MGYNTSMPSQPSGGAAYANNTQNSQSTGGWSARLSRFIENYPGFTATLLPELETWTDQDLTVYFGSNGDIWPRGQRPSWVRRPNAAAEYAAQQEREKPKTYPELKEHFK